MSEIDEKEIKRRFETISKFELRPEAVARDLERTRQNLAKKISEQQTTRQRIWRIIMKSNIAKFATAAVIIVGIMLVINYMGSSVDGTSVAWADVVRPILTARTVVFNVIMAEGENVPITRIMNM